jgi:transposase-like protein
MPLLNICVITRNNKVVQVALSFLSDETENSYNWALEQFQEIMAANNINKPLSIVTDREIALMNSIDMIFPESTHILCRWHVNMNVLAKTKKYVLASRRRALC